MTTENPAVMATWTFRSLLLGSALFGVLDFVVSSRVAPGAGVETAEWLRIFAVLFAQAISVGLVIGASGGILAGGIGFVDRLLARKITRVLFPPALVGAGFVYLNLETFSGGWISTQSWRPAAEWAFRVLGIGGLILVWWIVCRILGGTQAGSRRAKTMTGLFIFTTLGFLHANATIKVGLYAMLHTQLAWLCFFLSTLAAAPLNRRCSSRQTTLLILLAVLVLGAGIMARRHESWRRLAAAALPRGQAIQFLSPLTARLFDWLAPQRVVRRDIEVIEIPAEDSDARQVVDQWLDQNLPQRRRMNILLIAIDTWRADHAGFLGYGRNVTPEIDRLAASSFVFSRAYTTYPTSNFAYSSVFTGLYPKASPAYDGQMRMDWKFPEDFSIAGRLAAEGWTTIGATAFNRLAAADPRSFGTLAHGFTVYRPSVSGSKAHGGAVAEALSAELAVVEKRPWMAWLHLLEPHAPYDVWPEHNFGSSTIDAYDSEIAKSDAETARILQQLRTSGEADNTIVVIFSDHGEEFDEHGGRYHNTSLYEEQIHVPLIISVPGLRGRRIDEPVSLVDITPTLLQAVGVADPHRRHGRSLWPLLVGKGTNSPRAVFVEHFGIDSGRHVRDQRSVIEGQMKLIHRIQQDVYELYDLSADPGEKRNLIGLNTAEDRLLGLMASFARQTDDYHYGQDAAVSRPTSNSAAWHAEMKLKMSELMAEDTKTVNAAMRRIDEMLFDSLSNLLPEAKTALGTDGVRPVVDELIALAATLERPSNRGAVARILGRLRDQRAVPVLKTMFGRQDAALLSIACALAALGDASGTELLRAALSSSVPIPIETYDVAIALAQLGDHTALPWVQICLTSPKMPVALGMLGAVANLKDAELVRFVADLYYNRVIRGRPAVRALARTAGQMTEFPEGRWLLLMMTQDDDPVVREYAFEGARAAGISDEEITRLKPRLLAEQEGNHNVRNRAFTPAYLRYEEALKDAEYFNAPLRLRFARYLHMNGKTDEARTWLQSVANESTDDALRRVAKRRVDALGTAPRFTRRTPVKGEIVQFNMPKVIAPGQELMIEMHVTNTGDNTWPGGLWMYGTSLRILWCDDKGAPVPHNSPPKMFLPDEGVAPGETLKIQMVVAAPDVRDVDLEAVLILEQLSNGQMPDDGILVRLPGRVRIGVVK